MWVHVFKFPSLHYGGMGNFIIDFFLSFFLLLTIMLEIEGREREIMASVAYDLTGRVVVRAWSLDLPS